MKRRSPRSRKPRAPWFSILLFIVLLLAGVLSGARISFSPSGDLRLSDETRPVQARVVKVYDGDTIRISSGEKVRLIGIDTPEIHTSSKLYRDAERTGRKAEDIRRMGALSYEYAQRLLENRSVSLQFDAQRQDKYGRLLAYVYLDDGTFVNREIIRNGYAYPMSIPPNTRHAAEFKSLFEEARGKRVGLWGE